MWKLSEIMMISCFCIALNSILLTSAEAIAEEAVIQVAQSNVAQQVPRQSTQPVPSQSASGEQEPQIIGEDIADGTQDPFDEAAPLPSILDDFDPQSATFDAIIYKRKDFNDFYGKAIIIPFRYQARDR